MIPFTNTFTRISKDKRSELIALSVSILFSLMFLCSFALFYKPAPVNVIACPPTPTRTPARAEVVQAEEPKDPNERFRVVPQNFAHVNFNNWDYGRYRFGGPKVNLVLTAGQLEIPHQHGGGEMFSLADVLYTDVTGDGKQEAIVNLSHVQCGGSCDGGSNLFYVYQSSKNGLRKIWEYETGGMAYGCGMKSITVLKKMIVLEMFGQCWAPASSFGGTKFMVRDVTQSVFVFNGKRFLQHRMGIMASPEKDVKNYIPTVHVQQ